MINEYTTRLQEAYNDPETLQKVYVDICIKIGRLTDELVDNLRQSQKEKKEIVGWKSIAEFNRLWEESDTYIFIKSNKLQIEALDKLSWSCKARLDTLQKEYNNPH